MDSNIAGSGKGCFFFTKLSGRLLQESGIFLGIVKKNTFMSLKLEMVLFLII